MPPPVDHAVCRNCGRDLRGVASLACPGCGHRADSVAPLRRGPRIVVPGWFDIVTGRIGLGVWIAVLLVLIVVLANQPGGLSVAGVPFVASRRAGAIILLIAGIWIYLSEFDTLFGDKTLLAYVALCWVINLVLLMAVAS